MNDLTTLSYLDGNKFNEEKMISDILDYEFASALSPQAKIIQPQLVENPGEMLSNSDLVLFDLCLVDSQQSRDIYADGVDSMDTSPLRDMNNMGSNASHQDMLPMTDFNLYASSDDVNLADFGSRFFDSSASLYQNIPVEMHVTDFSQSLKNPEIGQSDYLHDRFRNRSLSIDSAFANYEEQTLKFLNGNISTTATYSGPAETHELQTTSSESFTANVRSQSVANLPDMVSTNDIQQTSSENNTCFQEGIYEELTAPNRYHIEVLPASGSKTVISTNIPMSSPRHEEEPKTQLSPIAETTDSMIPVTCHEELYSSTDSGLGADILLPTTLDSITVPSSPEVSLESLPESLQHLDLVPAGKSH